MISGGSCSEAVVDDETADDSVALLPHNVREVVSEANAEVIPCYVRLIEQPPEKEHSTLLLIAVIVAVLARV